MKFKVELIEPTSCVRLRCGVTAMPEPYILEAGDTSSARDEVSARAEAQDLVQEDFSITPLCPQCGEKLDSVGVETAGVVDVQDNGSYEFNGQESGKYTCGNCGKEIGGYAGGGRSYGFRPEYE